MRRASRYNRNSGYDFDDQEDMQDYGAPSLPPTYSSTLPRRGLPRRPLRSAVNHLAGSTVDRQEKVEEPEEKVDLS